MLAEIEGQWNLDGNVTYTRIVEAHKLSKEEIYNRALNYFVYNYGSGKSVIQTQDKDYMMMYTLEYQLSQLMLTVGTSQGLMLKKVEQEFN